MTNLEKLHMHHLLVSLDYTFDNLTSFDLLRVRNIISLLSNEIRKQISTQTPQKNENRNKK